MKEEIYDFHLEEKEQHLCVKNIVIVEKHFKKCVDCSRRVIDAEGRVVVGEYKRKIEISEVLALGLILNLKCYKDQACQIIFKAPK